MYNFFNSIGNLITTIIYYIVEFFKLLLSLFYFIISFFSAISDMVSYVPEELIIILFLVLIYAIVLQIINKGS